MLLIDLKVNVKGILVEEPNISNVQVAINLAIELVNQSAQEKMGDFDSWLDFRSVVHLEVLRKVRRVKEVRNS